MSHPKKTQSLALMLFACALILLSGCASDISTPHRSVLEPVIATAPGENYATLTENNVQLVDNQPVSTFSIDVDTASYANVRRFINDGYLPPREAVRIEEMINYFDYDYPPSVSAEEPFRIISEIGPTPWNSGSYLVHIGIKGHRPPQPQQPARNLVFLLDVSGSMDAANKLGLVKKSLRLLVNQLTAHDRVAIVVYAGASGLVLPSTSGNQRNEILLALQQLRAGGSTNGGAGIKLAYAIAQRNYLPDGVNRVILATDGDFNVGLSSTAALKQLIREKKRSGVGLTILGFGIGNYNDHMLEEISNNGDGNAAYIDTLQEAQKVLVHDIGGTLHTIARDTKIQVEFNHNLVSSYRLIGYENRMLRSEDFRNDHVDAGDVGAGHSVTAIYEINLRESLRYQAPDKPKGILGNELGFLRLRYKKPGQHTSQEMVHPLLKQEIRTNLALTSDNFRFSAAVSAFGQALRGSHQIGDYSLAEIENLARESRGPDHHGYRGELVNLISLAGSLR
jgi:Ca-activated chloride channel family protein